MKEKKTEKPELKYSEMLVKLVQEFKDQLPTGLTFEETLDIGVEAWNLANNKEFLVSRKLYNKELTAYKYPSIIVKMVDYKIDNFDDYNNIIINYNIDNNIIKVSTQSQQNHFDNILSNMIKMKPEN